MKSQVARKVILAFHPGPPSTSRPSGEGHSICNGPSLAQLATSRGNSPRRSGHACSKKAAGEERKQHREAGYRIPDLQPLAFTM
jgi:hypothetical protein